MPFVCSHNDQYMNNIITSVHDWHGHIATMHVRIGDLSCYPRPFKNCASYIATND